MAQEVAGSNPVFHPNVLIFSKTFSKEAQKYLKLSKVSYLCAPVLKTKFVLSKSSSSIERFRAERFRGLSQIRNWPHRLVVRSLPFQGSGTSSNLVGVTTRFALSWLNLSKSLVA